MVGITHPFPQHNLLYLVPNYFLPDYKLNRVKRKGNAANFRSMWPKNVYGLMLVLVFLCFSVCLCLIISLSTALCHKRTSHFVIVHIFAKCYPIFTILLLAHYVDSLQWDDYWIFHRTLTALLHYLVKYKFLKITIIRIDTLQKLIFWSNFLVIFILKLNCVWFSVHFRCL